MEALKKAAKDRLGPKVVSLKDEFAQKIQTEKFIKALTGFHEVPSFKKNPACLNLQKHHAIQHDRKLAEDEEKRWEEKYGKKLEKAKEPEESKPQRRRRFR